MLDELLKEARGWLSDVGLHVIGRDQTVISLVHVHYEGGWAEFVRADPGVDECAIWMQMCRQYGIDFMNRLHWLSNLQAAGGPGLLSWPGTLLTVAQ